MAETRAEEDDCVKGGLTWARMNITIPDPMPTTKQAWGQVHLKVLQ